MAYEVTATKKRPQSFDELAGQEFVVSTLKQSIDMGRIAHAYLFAGPRGVGKTSAARILAKALNCEKGPTSEPCNQCSGCREITGGRSLDVIEIDGASNTSVNDVREIKDEVLFAPNSLRYKIYIIDEVHMLSNSAFNALLKTIEEPPPYIVFIFATTEIHKVPATIRSRCQQFNFRLISSEVIRDLLAKTAEELKVEAERDALFWIAKEATGSLRDAYTLFDQVVSFSGGKITLERIREKLGLLGMEKMNSIFSAMSDENPTRVLEIAEEVLGRGVSVEQMIVDLAEYFRNILLIKHGITNEGVLGYPLDSFPRNLEKFSVPQLEGALRTLLDLHRNIRFSLNQRYELEVVLSRLSYLQRHLSAAEILGRIEKLKNSAKKGLISPSVEEASSKEENPREAGEEAENPDPKSFGKQLIQELKKKKLALSSALEKAVSWSWEGDALVAVFTSTYPANCVRDELKDVRKKGEEILGRTLTIEVKVGQTDKGESDGTAPVSENQNENDGIELVRRVFKGEILEGENS